MQFSDAIVKISGGIFQCLSDILVLKLGEFGAQLGTIGVRGQGFQDTANCQSHPADAGLAIHHRRIKADAI
jgi:hypothetical protein